MFLRFLHHPSEIYETQDLCDFMAGLDAHVTELFFLRFLNQKLNFTERLQI